MKEEYDQHFLNSIEILKREVEIVDISRNDIIFEIGAGDGRLSQEILKKNPSKLISVEVDTSLKENLDKIIQKFSNFEVIYGNGLDKIEKINFDKIVANIPYCITEPLYKKMMRLSVKQVVLIQGIRFFQQIKDKTSKWYYFVNSFYNIDLIEEISGDKFTPKAKTISVLLNLRLKNDVELTQKDKFFQILFSKQSRNTKNSLIFSFVDLGKTKSQAKEIIDKLNLTDDILSKKLENISNKDFVYIIKKIEKYL